MSDDYGRKIEQALAAVRRMHADVSKLLVDLDKTIGRGKTSVYGGRATSDMSGSYREPRWMTWFVHRYFVSGNEADASLVEAISVCFIDPTEPQRFDEPLLILGQIAYRLEPGQPVKAVCQEWDLVRAYLDWVNPSLKDNVQTGQLPEERKDIRWFKVIGFPLFLIGSMDRVVALMDRVRAAPAPVVESV